MDLTEDKDEDYAKLLMMGFLNKEEAKKKKRRPKNIVSPASDPAPVPGGPVPGGPNRDEDVDDAAGGDDTDDQNQNKGRRRGTGSDSGYGSDYSSGYDSERNRRSTKYGDRSGYSETSKFSPPEKDDSDQTNEKNEDKDKDKDKDKLTEEISSPSSNKPTEKWETFKKSKKKFHVQEIKQLKKMSKRRFIPTERMVKSSKSFKPPNRDKKTPRKKLHKKEKKEYLNPEGEEKIFKSRQKLMESINKM